MMLGAGEGGVVYLGQGRGRGRGRGRANRLVQNLVEAAGGAVAGQDVLVITVKL